MSGERSSREASTARVLCGTVITRRVSAMADDYTHVGGYPSASIRSSNFIEANMEKVLDEIFKNTYT